MARPVYILTMLTVMLFLATPVFARILYVTPNGDDANSGLIWAEAKRTVSAAIDAASSGDEIWVAAGTYYENIVMKGGLKLYGGFMGTEASLDERPPFPRPQPDPYETVLDGMQAGRVISVPVPATEPVVLNGLTIRRGASNDYGGGVYGNLAELYITNCRIIDCQARHAGGAVGGFIWRVNIENTVISNNRVGMSGGALYADNATLLDCVFEYNTAGEGGAIKATNSLIAVNCLFVGNYGIGEGGAILASTWRNPIVLQNCWFRENRAGIYGGAISHRGGPCYILQSRIEGNTADLGGGISTNWGGLEVEDCFIVNNTASDLGGGIIVIPNGTPQFRRCVIAYNRAPEGGGARCAGDATVSFTDCTFLRNTATRDGAGIVVSYSTSATLQGCTFSDNFAWRDGGGVFLSHSGHALLQNCTLERNRSMNSGAGIYCQQFAMVEVAYCAVHANRSVRDGAGIVVKTGATFLMQDCTVTANAAENNGGGFYIIDNGIVTLTRCAVSFNTAKNSGGGIYAYNSSPVVLYNMISGNSAGYYGGGVYCEWQASPQVLNTLILDNTAQRYGGGMYIYRESTPTITNCTFAFNTAPNQGGGIYTYGSSPSVNNTIVAFNTSGIYRSGGTPTLRYNCVYGNTAYNYKGITDPTGTNGNISVDPLLTGHNGHLLPGSPCINAGDNGATSSDWWDIDGESRILGDRVDIGADEFVAPTVNGRVIFGDYGGWLPPVLDMEVRLGAASEFRNLWLGTDGSFTLPSAPTGAFSLSTKPSHWLRRTVEVDTSAGSVSGVEIALTNGDINDDNEITLFDFGQLVQAFGSLPGDENWNANADLDGDGEVTLFDFGILVRYFGEVGDE